MKSMNNSAKRIALLVLIKFKRLLGGLWVDRIPGVQRAYKFLKRKLIPPSLVQVDYHGCKVFVDTRDEVLTPSLIANSRESYELQVFKELIKPGMVVVDIGANIGIYSIAAARLTGDVGKVYAFEPEAENYRILVKNIEANKLSNVIPIQKAVADESRVRRLFTSQYNLAGHSLEEANVQDLSGYEEVVSTSLDEFYGEVLRCQKVDILKSDAQGAEGLILDGGHRFLSENKFLAVMECWPYGLRRLGYDVEHLLDVFEEFGITYEVLDSRARMKRRMEPREIAEMCLRKESVDYHFSFLLGRTSV